MLRLQALAAIHAAGYLHGDVRGDNLMFEDKTGKVIQASNGLPLDRRRTC